MGSPPRELERDLEGSWEVHQGSWKGISKEVGKSTKGFGKATKGVGKGTPRKLGSPPRKLARGSPRNIITSFIASIDLLVLLFHEMLLNELNTKLYYFYSELLQISCQGSAHSLLVSF